MPVNLDVRTGVLTATIVLGLLALLSLWSGVRSIARARSIPYFRMRRDGMVRGWRRVFFFVVLGALAYAANGYAEPVAYSFYPPSATPTFTVTVSLTPTISQTPTITLSPTITPTPEVSNTPTITPTPHIPLAIEAQFEGNLTPPPDVAFSRLQFTNQGVDSLYRPIKPAEVFTNPVGQMYAYFTYDGMADETQWTALWYYEGELVHFETSPWHWGSGGAGFSDWQPDAEDWRPGEYRVEIFIGLDWIVGGSFVVEGEPPTSTPTPTSTYTPTYTPSITPTITPWPTQTRTPTPTITPTVPTATPSPTYTPSLTLTPSQTLTPTPITPTATLSPTITRWPTATPITPTPTITRRPTATP